MVNAHVVLFKERYRVHRLEDNGMVCDPNLVNKRGYDFLTNWYHAFFRAERPYDVVVVDVKENPREFGETLRNDIGVKISGGVGENIVRFQATDEQIEKIITQYGMEI